MGTAQPNQSKIKLHPIIYKIIPYLIIIFYVLIFTWQVNLWPMERYPGWDNFWVDVRNAGTLISVKQALVHFELPHVVPYTDFGWNLVGNHHSFFNPFNLLVLVLKPATVLAITQMIFLLIGATGVYTLLKRLTGKGMISLLGGLSYISLPFVISLQYYETTSFCFYCIPWFLVLIHRLIEAPRPRNYLLFTAFSIFAIASCEIYALITFTTTIFVYTLFVGWRYYQFKLSTALKKALVVLCIFILSSSFYTVPLYQNLTTISKGIDNLKNAHILPDNYVSSKIDFLSFFYHYGLESLAKPFEGSALLLYIPVLFYFTLLFAFIWRCHVFKHRPRQMVIIYILVALAVLMFIESLLFYSPLIQKLLPGLRENARGVLRVHLNLIPFVLTLAGFICLAAMNRLKDKNLKRKIYILIALSALASSLIVFHLGRGLLANPPFGSTNKIPLPFKNPLNFLAGLNIIFIGLVFAYNLLNKNKSVVVFLTILTILVPLLSISVYNEIFSYLGQTRNPYRWQSYLERKNCIDSLINRYDPNYRTLYAAKGNFGPTSGRDWKLIAETELHLENKEKTFFAYREFTNPYVGLIHGTFPASGQGFDQSNLFPPTSQEIIPNLNTIKLMGVKWIISADETISHPDLIYRGACSTANGPMNQILDGEPEGGTMFIYELIHPLAISFLIDHYQKTNLNDALNTLRENKKHPWLDNLVYLEKEPIASIKNNTQVDRSNFSADPQIIKETYTSKTIGMANEQEKYLVLSYLYDPQWEARLDGKSITIYRAYGGLMAIKIPPGQHILTLKYFPADFYLGCLLTIYALIISLGIAKNNTPKNMTPSI